MNAVSLARVNRNKKLDHEKKRRLLEVHRNKTEIFNKQVEQKKLLLEKLPKVENAETKKKLRELLKTLDTSSEILKKELEDLSEEIRVISLTKTAGSAVKKRIRENTVDLDEDEVPRKVGTIGPDVHLVPDERVIPDELPVLKVEDNEVR